MLDNKGIGAGGFNTTLFGKNFEERTNFQHKLLEMGFHKYYLRNTYYLSKRFENKKITLQGGFKKYMKQKYNIDVFRYPDEAYIINYNTGKTVIKILEKKNQNTEGSCETKLWASPSLKREYELKLGDKFEIHYGLCVNDYLKQKMTSNTEKYVILNKILGEHNVDVLFGDDDDYFDKLCTWFNTI